MKHFLKILFYSFVTLFHLFQYTVEGKGNLFERIETMAKKLFGISLPRNTESFMTPEEFVKFNNYPYQGYEVETEDGYILSLHRIPGNKTITNSNQLKGVVYLQHGFLCSSCDFLLNLPNQSLAYILADQGMDVWLGDSRGNRYSKKHKTYSPNERSYWDWSYDEMAEYDLPAFVSFILNKTGHPNLYYVGHSQGSMIAFAKFSRDFDFARKIKIFFALAPVVYLGHVKTPFRTLAEISRPLSLLKDLTGRRDFMPNNVQWNWFAAHFCPRETVFNMCKNLLHLIGGPQTGHLNKSRLAVIYGHYPSGTSFENFIHLTQGIKTNHFRNYDYGWMENLRAYKQMTPPDYRIENIKVPIEIFWGFKDWLSTPRDVERLIKEIPNLTGNHFYEDANHFDFIYGTNSHEDYYKHIVNRIRETL